MTWRLDRCTAVDDVVPRSIQVSYRRTRANDRFLTSRWGRGEGSGSLTAQEKSQPGPYGSSRAERPPEPRLPGFPIPPSESPHRAIIARRPRASRSADLRSLGSQHHSAGPARARATLDETGTRRSAARTPLGRPERASGKPRLRRPLAAQCERAFARRRLARRLRDSSLPGVSDVRARRDCVREEQSPPETPG